MKKNPGNKIKLGLFVSIGILLFIVAIYYIGKKQQLFNKTFRVSCVFKDVNGLRAGNNVRFSGINVSWPGGGINCPAINVPLTVSLSVRRVFSV